MDSKEVKMDSSVETLQLIIKKIRQKGPDFLEKEQMAVCLTTVGFQDVCKKVGIVWNAGIEKQFKEKLDKMGFELGWLDKKTSADLAPFLVHCARGDVTKVKEFIKKTPAQEKLNLTNAVDSSKKSALHIASREGYDVLVDYLISQKFSINARDKELKTPLHYASMNSHQNAVHSLLNNNADIFAKDYKGESPLHCAVRSGSSKIVSQLLEKGPRLTDLRDFSGKTALHYAAVSGIDNQVDVIRLLMESGARVDERDSDGRTALHYACEYGKARCIPILLKNKATVTIKDNAKKSAFDLASNQKIKKLIEAYSGSKGLVSEVQEKEFKQDYNSKLQKSQVKDKGVRFNARDPKEDRSTPTRPSSNNPLLGGQVNQVSTWLRQKFFVLMKKLQESGVKIRYHIKKPYCYTGSWMEQIESIEELFQALADLSGPQVAIRTFNILCPYQKKLPTGISAIDAVEGFFGQTWFGGQASVNAARKAGKGDLKLKQELQDKGSELQELRLTNMGYQSQLQKLESKLSQVNQELKQYKKVEDQIRKERVKNAKQYSEILRLTNEVEDLKKEVSNYESGHDANLSLQQRISQLKKKNQDLTIEVDALKSYEAAARRKCGKVFLKALHTPFDISSGTLNNLYDDDSVIHLYELLQNNPPSMVKRLEKANKSGTNQLTVFEFNYFLQELNMLPQDIMSMNRIVGFVSGRKVIRVDEFKQILSNRPQIRVEWERKLINKVKSIINHSQVGTIEKLFGLLDKDGNNSLSIGELKEGLEEYNIYINQSDINNLFSLLDADRSGNINLEELNVLLQTGVSGKKVPSGKEFDQQEEESVKKSTQTIKAEQDQEYPQDHQQQDDQQDQQLKNGEEGQEHQKEQQNEPCDEQQANQNKDQQDNGDNEDNEDHEDNQENGENEDKDNGDNQDNGDIKQTDNKEFLQSPEKNYSVNQEQLENFQLLESVDDLSPIVNGKCKVQIPFCKDIPDQQMMNNVVLRVEFFGHETVKVGDFTKKKWEIAVEFNIQNMRMSHSTPLKISVYADRQFDEDNFLGMIEIPFQDLLQKPNQWAVNKSLPLEPSPDYEKEVMGKIGIQAKWVQEQPIDQQEPQ